jgi:hypothetical protein
VEIGVAGDADASFPRGPIKNRAISEPRIDLIDVNGVPAMRAKKLGCANWKVLVNQYRHLVRKPNRPGAEALLCLDADSGETIISRFGELSNADRFRFVL